MNVVHAYSCCEFFNVKRMQFAEKALYYTKGHPSAMKVALPFIELGDALMCVAREITSFAEHLFKGLAIALEGYFSNRQGTLPRARQMVVTGFKDAGNAITAIPDSVINRVSNVFDGITGSPELAIQDIEIRSRLDLGKTLFQIGFEIGTSALMIS